MRSASNIFVNFLRQYKGYGLSVGSMLVGSDDKRGV